MDVWRYFSYTDLIFRFLDRTIPELYHVNNKQDEDSTQWVLNDVALKTFMTDDIAKEVKNKQQDIEAKLKTEADHAEGKPSSETLNKAKVKRRDTLT